MYVLFESINHEFIFSYKHQSEKSGSGASETAPGFNGN